MKSPLSPASPAAFHQPARRTAIRRQFRHQFRHGRPAWHRTSHPIWHRSWAFALALVGALGAVGGRCGAADTLPPLAYREFRQDAEISPEIDMIMLADPKLEVPGVEVTLSQEYIDLWLKVLELPEVDLRCQALDTIAAAHRRGAAGLQQTIPHIKRTLDQAQDHRLLRRAAVLALVVLDAQQHAKQLAALAEKDQDLALIVEPALAKWNYPPFREVWLQRLTAAVRPQRLRLRLAMEGLAQVGERQAVPPLQAFAKDVANSSSMRIAACRALAALQADGLEPLAAVFASSEAPRVARVEHLMAAELLKRHTSPRAVELLLQLARGASPAVRGTAYRYLLESAPQQTLPLIDDAVGDVSSVVRGCAIDSLRLRGDAEAVALLGPLLKDAHPDNRRAARAALAELGGDSQLKPHVVDQLERLLADDDWRAWEQAAHLAVALDHKAAAPRLVELLLTRRSEAFVAAAWALKKLEAEAVYPEIIEAVKKRVDGLKLHRSVTESQWVFAQLTQLFELFGKVRYQPADALLQTFIPKEAGFGANCRCAAIWALGHLHEGKAPPSLTAKLVARYTDVNSQFPEMNEVRRFSAISLGRMHSVSAVRDLRRILDGDSLYSHTGQAAGWALERLTGEKMPQMPLRQQQYTNFFLEPLSGQPPRAAPESPPSAETPAGDEEEKQSRNQSRSKSAAIDSQSLDSVPTVR